MWRTIGWITLTAAFAVASIEAALTLRHAEPPLLRQAWIPLAVGAMAPTVFLLWGLYREAQDLFPEEFLPKGWSASANPFDGPVWPLWKSGSMPHSVRLEGANIFRFQARKHLEVGEHWYRMFWDLSYKYRHGRYSGRIIPGHYFAASLAGAMKEIDAYESEPSEYELFKGVLNIDNVLDLTSRENLHWLIKTFFAKHTDAHWSQLLFGLVSPKLGGGLLDEFVGSAIETAGYSGAIYFGARSLPEAWAVADIGPLSDENADLDYWAGEWPRQADLINVIIFFGHDVVRSVGSYWVGERGPFANELFGLTYDELDAVFASDPAKPSDSDLSFESIKEKSDRWSYVGPLPGARESDSAQQEPEVG